MLLPIHGHLFRLSAQWIRHDRQTERQSIVHFYFDQTRNKNVAARSCSYVSRNARILSSCQPNRLMCIKVKQGYSFIVRYCIYVERKMNLFHWIRSLLWFFSADRWRIKIRPSPRLTDWHRATWCKNDGSLMQQQQPTDQTIQLEIFRIIVSNVKINEEKPLSFPLLVYGTELSGTSACITLMEFLTPEGVYGIGRVLLRRRRRKIWTRTDSLSSRRSKGTALRVLNHNFWSTFLPAGLGIKII